VLFFTQVLLTAGVIYAAYAMAIGAAGWFIGSVVASTKKKAGRHEAARL
jgi:hypothetical protein